jgi:hypothetical protein
MIRHDIAVERACLVVLRLRRKNIVALHLFVSGEARKDFRFHFAEAWEIFSSSRLLGPTGVSPRRSNLCHVWPRVWASPVM